jgi:hypothetical protein
MLKIIVLRHFCATFVPLLKQEMTQKFVEFRQKTGLFT